MKSESPLFGVYLARRMRHSTVGFTIQTLGSFAKRCDQFLAIVLPAIDALADRMVVEFELGMFTNHGTHLVGIRKCRVGPALKQRVGKNDWHAIMHRRHRRRGGLRKNGTRQNGRFAGRWRPQ